MRWHAPEHFPYATTDTFSCPGRTGFCRQRRPAHGFPGDEALARGGGFAAIRHRPARPGDQADTVERHAQGFGGNQAQNHIAALADNSVNLTVRAWTKNEDYWDVFFAMNELYYKILPEKGINFPFPQMDVHLTKE